MKGKKVFIAFFVLFIVSSMAMAQESGGEVRRPVKKENSSNSSRNQRTPNQNRQRQQSSEANTRNVNNNVYEKTGSHNGYDYVDLGLSVKWATCNIGTKSPSGWGNYFAWGETQIKSDYSWTTYFDSKDSNGTEFYTYYWGTRGFNSISSTSGHDVARVIWGGEWRMPTEEELKELLSKCDWKYTNLVIVKK